MSVQFRLKELMAERERVTGKRITYRMLRDATGISTNTLHKAATNQQKRVGFGVLARLCDYFGCHLGDLLVYVPDDRLSSPSLDEEAGG